MVNRKRVRKLEDLCFPRVVENFVRYVRFYRDVCKENQEKYTDSRLYAFHVIFSEKLISALRNRQIVSDAHCPSSQQYLIDFNYKERYLSDFNFKDRLTEENYLAFLFNPLLKEFDISLEHPKWTYQDVDSIPFDYPSYPFEYRHVWMRPFFISPALLKAFSTIGKNLSVVNVQGCNITEEDFPSFLKAIPQVVSLNISHTCCSDSEMSIIRKYCPLLKELHLSETKVTDKGIKNFCGAKYERKNMRNYRLTSLSVHSTQISLKGAITVLKSFPRLQLFRYTTTIHCKASERKPVSDLQVIPLSYGNAGVPWLLHETHRQNPDTGKIPKIRQYLLKELFFGFHELRQEILQTVLSCCPALKSLTIWPQITAEMVLQCTKFLNLTELHIRLGRPVPKDALNAFFALKGPKLQVLDLSPVDEYFFVDFEDLVSWLNQCPELKRFICSGAVIDHRGCTESEVSTSLPSLTKIILSNLKGFAVTHFLTYICLAPSLTCIWLVYIDHSVDKPLQGARKAGRLCDLDELNIYHCAVTIGTLFTFFEKSVSRLRYSFTECGMVDLLNFMKKIAKDENIEVEVSDCGSDQDGYYLL